MSPRDLPSLTLGLVLLTCLLLSVLNLVPPQVVVLLAAVAYLLLGEEGRGTRRRRRDGRRERDPLLDYLIVRRLLEEDN